MKIQEIISCVQLVRGDRRPVSARVLGELLPGLEYKRIRPFFLDTKNLSFQSNNSYMDIYAQTDCPPVPVNLFRFSNAIVFGQGSVVIGNKDLLLESAAEFVNHGLAPEGSVKAADGYETLHDDARLVVEGTSLLAKRPWFRNFGHWLVDLMPLLPLVKDAALDVDSVIFGAVPEGVLKDLMQATAQRVYPDADIIYMSDDQQLSCRRLLYVQPVHVPPLFKHPLAIKATAAFAEQLFTNSTGDFGDRIYVSRQRQYARKVTNDDDLTEVLTEFGFRTIYPEEHSIDDQISIFAKAKVIVGVKGAAFANLVFCDPGTHVLVFSPPSFIDPFFWDLACIKGVFYSEIFCPTKDEGESNSLQSLEVPLSSLRKFLKRL